MSTLYVVATPIGNLSDLTERAATILSSVPTVAAEDTRVTRKLLKHIDASPLLESLHEHTSPQRLKKIISRLESGDMGFVTDAGTPGISDPGASLVKAALVAGHNVVPLPGASALTTALSITGWSFDRFLFLGFLPRKKPERISVLESVITEPGPIVIYESPRRLKATLEDINEIVPDRQLVICRELTKLYEETFRGTAAQSINHFSTVRGEFVIVIKGATKSYSTMITDKEIRSVLNNLESQGLSGRSLVDQTVKITKATKNRVYRLSLEHEQ